MGLIDGIRSFFTLDLQERSLRVASWEFPNLETQLARAMRVREQPWNIPSIRQALGVPAIFGAVNMISNLTGSMPMKALRNEVEMPPADRPRLIVRPTPGQIPREFYRGTAYNLATRGEAWWWVGKRDIDGSALSLYNVPPQEVNVTENPRDFRYPEIRWRDELMSPDDLIQLVYAREPGELRGHGPLQMCGAAISVAVEAQEWAANYFSSGGTPSTVVKTAIDMTEQEAADFKAQWISTPSNTPRIITPAVESVTEHGSNSHGAQMLDSRGYQNAEVATMFGMDATLLNAAISGSSVTYQNVGSEFDKFLRGCLQPNYLEPIEQTMSDLLTRTTVARFDTDRITLADIKTRYDVYGVGIDKGIIDAEDARRFEGLSPGDVENASVPPSLPDAIPFSIPIQARSIGEAVRCGCGKLLAELATSPYRFTCPRCKDTVAA